MHNIIENNINELKKICKILNIKKMVIFGSAVANKLTDESDLDFLISFKDDISVEEYTDNYFKLHYKLRKIFNREIDIITERTLSNPYLIESINKMNKVIYEA